MSEYYPWLPQTSKVQCFGTIIKGFLSLSCDEWLSSNLTGLWSSVTKNNCTDFSYIAKIIWEFWNEGLAQDELFFKRVIYDASRELWSCLRFCNTMGFKDLKESSLTH